MNIPSAILNPVLSGKNFRWLYICFAIVLSFIAILTILFGLKSVSVMAASTKVGIVFSGPSYEDNGFYWQTYQGLLRAENELDVIGSIYTSTNLSDIELQVQQCAQDGNDLCFGADYLVGDVILNTAAIYASTKFAVIDAAYEDYPSNLRGIVFASEQVGYLAGTLAAMMTQSDIIGDLGGMEIPPVTAFTIGYRNGAQCANPGVTTIISYTNDFANPELGSQFAQGMIDQGADVIFAAAGGTGYGALLTTTQSNHWAIGVDTDQYYSVFMSGTVPGSNYLLSSAMKRTDNAAFYTISDVVAGTFTPGTVVYTLVEDGVGLAPFHETEAFVTQDIRSRLTLVKQALIDGTIDPLDAEGQCLVTRQFYLPMTAR
jgi:basic membrane protein A